MSKKEAMKAHAIKRAKQRFGLGLTLRDCKEISRMIRSGQTISSVRQTNSRSIHRIQYHEKECDVVYCKNRHVIVTFLYPKERN